MNTRTVFTAVVASVLCVASVAHAEVTEIWQSRLIEAVQEMAHVEDQFAPTRFQLTQERKDVTHRAAALRASIKAAQKQATRICGRSDEARCLEARADAQEAHLDFTENVNDRLQVEARLVDQNFEYSLKMADVIAGVIADIEKQIAHADANASQKSVAQAESRTQHFMAKALPALQEAAVYNHAVARSSRDRARMAAARDVAVAIERFRTRYAHDANGRSPVERLGVLKARFEAFAAINKQARAALDANAAHLRGINALAATSLAEGMIASYEGGLQEYGRKFIDGLDKSFPAFEQDIGLLYEGLEGAQDDPNEGFFDADEGFFN